MRSITSALLLLCLASLGACILGGQTGQEGHQEQEPACGSEDDQVREPIALDEDPGLGFTRQEMLDLVTGPHTAQLLWNRTGETTELELQLESAGMPELVRSVGPRECPGIVRVPGILQVSTADGQLLEALAVELEATGPESVTVRGRMELTQLAGAWSATDHDLDLANWSDPQMFFVFWLADSSPLGGSVSLGGGDPNPGDNATPVSAAIADIPAP